MDKMQNDIKTLSTDVAVIKERLNVLCKTEERKLAVRQGIFISIVSGIVAFVISFFKPS
jgi:hypothetical protein